MNRNGSFFDDFNDIHHDINYHGINLKLMGLSVLEAKSKKPISGRGVGGRMGIECPRGFPH